MQGANSMMTTGIESKVRGISPCPTPVMDERVVLAMTAWGRWQWKNRNRMPDIGYPSVSTASADWGLGCGGEFEDEEALMPPLVELVDLVLMDLKGPARQFALARWAMLDMTGLSKVGHTAERSLPYDVQRVDCERWLAAIAGGVMAKLGDIDLDV